VWDSVVFSLGKGNSRLYILFTSATDRSAFGVKGYPCQSSPYRCEDFRSWLLFAASTYKESRTHWPPQPTL